MDNRIREDKGTYILGSYFSHEEIIEIENNPDYKNTLAKNILDLRRANEELIKGMKETKIFKLLIKFLK